MAKNKSIYLRSREYKPIPGYLGYFVSAYGQVASLWRHSGQLGDQPHLLKPIYHHAIRPCFIHGQSHRKVQTSHAVLLAWVGPRPQGFYGLHKDDHPRNNHWKNLYWGTAKQNAADSITNGSFPKGERNGMAKTTQAFVTKLRSDALRLTRKALYQKYSNYPRPYLWQLLTRRWSVHDRVPLRGNQFWSQGEHNHQSRLNASLVCTFRTLALSNSILTIANSYSRFSYDAIREAVRGQTWSHLPGAVRSEWAQEHWRLKKKSAKPVPRLVTTDPWQML